MPWYVMIMNIVIWYNKKTLAIVLIEKDNNAQVNARVINDIAALHGE